MRHILNPLILFLTSIYYERDTVLNARWENWMSTGYLVRLPIGLFFRKFEIHEERRGLVFRFPRVRDGICSYRYYLFLIESIQREYSSSGRK